MRTNKYFTIFILILFVFITSNCSNSNETKSNSVKIEGLYSGTNNWGYPSTIKLTSNGSFIIESPVQDFPEFGEWVLINDNRIDLYTDGYKIFTVIVSQQGIRVEDGNFYKRIR